MKSIKELISKYDECSCDVCKKATIVLNEAQEYHEEQMLIQNGKWMKDVNDKFVLLTRKDTEIEELKEHRSKLLGFNNKELGLILKADVKKILQKHLMSEHHLSRLFQRELGIETWNEPIKELGISEEVKA
mgnify:CR=1 FL=1